MDENILFVCGSLNQTTQMHQIARHLQDYNCYFTPFYTDGFLGLLAEKNLLDFTILGGRHRRSTEDYLAQEGLHVDFGGQARRYDLVVACTDLIIPRNLRGSKLVLVQEGMMESEGLAYQLVRFLKLPRFLANTAATGLSDAYDVFCVASPGYRDLFIRKGVKPDKIAVTGIPNFDHAEAWLENDFPHRHFVLVATSCARETFKWDHRTQFIREAIRIAAGRKLVFKLHPNEKVERARREILSLVPEALIYESGNVNHMVANCDVLITQFSSVVYVGIALGKEVYSFFDIETLKKLAPIQNGGTSAHHIARICSKLILAPADEREHANWRYRPRTTWHPMDIN